MGGTPDVYEQPRGMLDLTLKQKLRRRVSLSFAAKNLLEAKIEKSHTYKGENFPSRVYKLGRVFSLGLSYSLADSGD
jgi:hypothetical protein